MLVVFSTILAQGPARAQESLDDETDTPSYWKTHFSLHGYATLGYADTNLSVDGFPTADENMLGIEEDGSFPYGNAAVNLRYDPSPKHSFVLQVAAAELGDSPVDELSDDVELDWLFYQGKITQNFWVRLGRHPVPVGIFNEVRDAGILLPFFRPSYVFYREGALLSETIDGIAVRNLFFPKSSWSLEGTAYYGEFDVFQQGLGFDQTVIEGSADQAVGTQLWLSTPVNGLRLGLGGLRFRLREDSPSTATDESIWKSAYVSIDGDFDRWVARAEYRFTDIAYDLDGAEVYGLEAADYYFQIGWRPVERLGLYAQSEFSEPEQIGAFFLGGSESFDARRDNGFSIVYELRPSIVLRGEYHEVKAEAAVDGELIISPGGVFLHSIYESFDSDYTILSVSLAF